MEAIMQAVRQAMSATSKTFSAVEKFAGAAEHIGTVCEEAAGAFADEQRYKRAANLKLMRKEFDINLEAKDMQLTAKATKIKSIAM